MLLIKYSELKYLSGSETKECKVINIKIDKAIFFVGYT